jgi:hypothetical protein
MVRHGGHPPIRVSVEDMASALSHRGEAKGAQYLLHLRGADDAESAHALTTIF